MVATGNFTNKVAIVTGASSGIGQTTAILFAKKGASVVLCGRDEERLKSSMDQCIEASGGHAKRFTTVIGDVTKPEVRKNIVDEAVEIFKQLDILVANAGVVLPEKGIINTTEAIYNEVFDTNVKAVFFLIQAALPHLEKSGGNIVNVSSISSIMPRPGFNAYAMSKATVDHMTRCLSLDLASKGVRVNAVNPSFVATNIARFFGDSLEESTRMLVERETPKQILHGTCVTPEAIADTIAFLASDASKFVTGQCHIVDGGRLYAGS